MNVTVLGASGMLGSMVVEVLAREPGLTVTATVRDERLIPDPRKGAGPVVWKQLDAESGTVDDLRALLGGADWVVNAIGVIKPLIHDDRAGEVERAIRVNALFPHLLAQAIASTSCRVLQIATDCVYSGKEGRYLEANPHDPTDVYGKSKSLGEVHAARFHHLRCSIIGPELKGRISLLEWFLGQPQGASLKGFVNHHWNGVTTYHFARLCAGIIRTGLPLPHLQHVVPTGDITKLELLLAFAKTYSRADLTITPTEAPGAIDRTLRTVNAPLNLALWQAAGYAKPPSVPDMVSELALLRK